MPSGASSDSALLVVGNGSGIIERDEAWAEIIAKVGVVSVVLVDGIVGLCVGEVMTAVGATTVLAGVVVA
jgi:hypothetical protein